MAASKNILLSPVFCVCSLKTSLEDTFLLEDTYTNQQYIHLASEENKKRAMAKNQDIEKAENSLQEEIKVPLISQEKRAENVKNCGGSDKQIKEERCMVYLSTFVAVCGSYSFGSCVRNKYFF